MRDISILFLIFVAVTGISVAGQITDVETDPVAESFDRAFNHEPAPAAPATRESIDDDVLYDLVNLPLQTPEPALWPDVDREGKK